MLVICWNSQQEQQVVWFKKAVFCRFLLVLAPETVSKVVGGKCQPLSPQTKGEDRHDAHSLTKTYISQPSEAERNYKWKPLESSSLWFMLFCCNVHHHSKRSLNNKRLKWSKHVNKCACCFQPHPVSKAKEMINNKHQILFLSFHFSICFRGWELKVLGNIGFFKENLHVLFSNNTYLF